MSKHTPEPWLTPEQSEFADTGFVSVIKATSGEEVLNGCGCCGSPNLSLNDARRIVACVNACRGLGTEELEQSGLIGAVGTEKLQLDARIETLEQQRDKLLAALERIASTNASKHGLTSMMIDRCMRIANEAILEVKGDK